MILERIFGSLTHRLHIPWLRLIFGHLALCHLIFLPLIFWIDSEGQEEVNGELKMLSLQLCANFHVSCPRWVNLKYPHRWRFLSPRIVRYCRSHVLDCEFSFETIIHRNILNRFYQLVKDLVLTLSEELGNKELNLMLFDQVFWESQLSVHNICERFRLKRNESSDSLKELMSLSSHFSRYEINIWFTEPHAAEKYTVSLVQFVIDVNWYKFWDVWYRFWDGRSYRWGDHMPSNIFWDWFWSASMTFWGVIDILKKWTGVYSRR
jgi:hypothetical protein